jgi:hypothetical protein
MFDVLVLVLTADMVFKIMVRGHVRGLGHYSFRSRPPDHAMMATIPSREYNTPSVPTAHPPNTSQVSLRTPGFATNTGRICYTSTPTRPQNRMYTKPPSSSIHRLRSGVRCHPWDSILKSKTGMTRAHVMCRRTDIDICTEGGPENTKPIV